MFAFFFPLEHLPRIWPRRRPCRIRSKVDFCFSSFAVLSHSPLFQFSPILLLRCLQSTLKQPLFLPSFLLSLLTSTRFDRSWRGGDRPTAGRALCPPIFPSFARPPPIFYSPRRKTDGARQGAPSLSPSLHLFLLFVSVQRRELAQRGKKFLQSGSSRSERSVRSRARSLPLNGLGRRPFP